MKKKFANTARKLLFSTSLSAALFAVVTSNSLASETRSEVSAGKHYIESDFKIKLSGYAHFQSGYRNQSKLSGQKEKKVSANRNDFAFYNDAAFVVTASKGVNEVDCGAKIVLVPTAKKSGSASYNGSHIFVESSFGRVEMGSPISAGSQMFSDAFSITAATGDDWGRYADFSTDHLRQNEMIAGKTIGGVTYAENQLSPSFVTFSEFYLDSRLSTELDDRKFSSEPSRSVSYYTPNFELGSTTKIQLGISYIPDSANTGADGPGSLSSGEVTRVIVEGKEEFRFDNSVKDAFTGGICIEQNISDGVDVKLAFTGEHGKSAGGVARKSENPDLDGKTYKLKDLRTYNVGGVINIGNFSLAGSYGSLGKSLTTPEYHKTGRGTTYYTGAIAYKYGAFNTSLSYFKSDQFKNTVDAVSLGTDFKIAPGLKPYAEVSTYTLKGRPEFFPELKKKTSRGTVALLGLKLSI